MVQICIIGGGLAGLTSAYLLAKQGIDVTLIEKKIYPFHKVCGEYVSNEVLPFLKRIGLDPAELKPARIQRFLLASPKGRILEMPLDMGGFGISRYALDNFFYEKAKEAGVKFMLGVGANDVAFSNDAFMLSLSDGSRMEAKIVVGTYGKRSKLDRQLGRPFFNKRSPYIGVKYHVQVTFPDNMIALYNFPDGYCGINKIEDDRVCLCYLTTRENLRKHGSIPEMEKQVLYQNPLLKEIFKKAEHLYDKPEVINEISFASKEAVKDHILMSGDAAGMIAPLCGNGMAMAIHSAKILSEEIIKYFGGHRDRYKLEQNYQKEWNRLFARRMWIGRQVQSLFGHPMLSETAVGFFRQSKPLAKWVMKRTHGEVF
jgi:flavin-dependent dehydrogenase